LYNVLETVQEVVDEFCNEGRPTPTQRMTRQEYAQLLRRPSMPVAAAGANFAANIFTLPPPPPPPPPAFNPLPPTLNFAVQPPRPTGMPAGFSVTGTSPSATGRRAKKGQASSRSNHASIAGAKIVRTNARIENIVDYKAPSSLKMESLSNLEKVPPEDAKKLERDNIDCAICLCQLVEKNEHQTRREKRDATLAQLPCG
jgi:hypothetical protein